MPGMEQDNHHHHHDDTHNGYDGRAFDMYSLGVIMWECWYQQEPKLMPPPAEKNSSLGSLENIFEENQPSQTQSEAMRQSHHTGYEAMERDNIDMMLRKTVDGYRPPLNINSPFQNMPPMLISLVTRLWSNQPENRPSSSEVRDLINSTQFKEEIQQVERNYLRK
jgi:serine/threonine protein kinase